MQYKNGTLSFSASDLTVYLDSPFASWMDRYALESPSIDIEPDEIDSMVQLLFDKGYKHEEQVETELRQEADSYIRIDGADEAEKIANTRSAMASGVVCASSKVTVAVLASNETATVETPGTAAIEVFTM